MSDPNDTTPAAVRLVTNTDRDRADVVALLRDWLAMAERGELTRPSQPAR
jgi:hypothetical protein